MRHLMVKEPPHSSQEPVYQEMTHTLAPCSKTLDLSTLSESVLKFIPKGRQQLKEYRLFEESLDIYESFGW
jgi:hypothetical protein